MTDSVDKPIRSEIVLYQTEDSKTWLEVRLENETVGLTQNQMAELFQTSISNVSMHIRNIFREGELQEDSGVKDLLTTAAGIILVRADAAQLPNSGGIRS